jgi:hypothetical protein
MDRLTFVPSAGELFLYSEQQAPRPPHSALTLRLAALGWPISAHLLARDGARAQVEGLLIELIDALPVLAAPCLPADEPVLHPFCALGRLALSLTARGDLLPWLRPRYDDHGPGVDPRPTGWTAGWMAVPTPAERRDLHALAAAMAPPGRSLPVALPAGRLASAAQLRATARHAHAGPEALCRRLVHACGDTLVREAGWRGAVVRIGGWPSDAWEQRLVHALHGPHPSFTSEDPDPRHLADEINAWSRDQAGGGLLPSPPCWRAPESLRALVTRLVAPAAGLAARLLRQEPAPRTL